MLDKILREVVAIVVGKQAEPIVEIIHSKKYINEFTIAKKLEITINQTRNILYKMADHGLVASERKKDKKKGWYTYFWKIEVLKSLEFLREILSKKLVEAEAQIHSRKTKQFYVCKRCNLEFTEENAMLRNFVCPECEDIFELKDNTPDLRELNKIRDKSLKELGFINEEISLELEKIEKAREREKKKLDKIKKLKKEAEKVARALTRKKNAKNKPPKKKVVKKKVVRKKPVKKKTVKRKVVKKKPAKKKVVKRKSAKKKVVKRKVAKKKSPKNLLKKLVKKKLSKVLKVKVKKIHKKSSVKKRSKK